MNLWTKPQNHLKIKRSLTEAHQITQPLPVASGWSFKLSRGTCKLLTLVRGDFFGQSHLTVLVVMRYRVTISGQYAHRIFQANRLSPHGGLQYPDGSIAAHHHL